jgi:hypothetical protein
MAQNYRYVKIHEVSPTLANTWRGDYFDMAESTCQWNPNVATTAPYVSTLMAGIPTLVADPRYNETGRTVPVDFKAQLGAFLCNAGPVDIFQTNLNYIHAFGTTGWTVVPDADFPPSDANAVLEAPTLEANVMNPNAPRPISTWTRGGRTCQPGRVVDNVSGTTNLN